ncbi:hypothetical protein ACE1CD_30140 [Aerosakkonema sp. BLCC-F183]|uniref:hypothetical protein n=1 Tax=Aerosakkonema sp. BLCC-F183 TaxID=3342834 RepID=UPI0035BAAA78
MNNEENQEQQASEESTVNEVNGGGSFDQNTSIVSPIEQSVSGETNTSNNPIDGFVNFVQEGVNFVQEGIDRLGQVVTGSQNQMQSEEIKVYTERLNEAYTFIKEQLSQGSSISPPEMEKINQRIYGGLKVIEHLKQTNESLKSKNESLEGKNRSLLSENNLLNQDKQGLTREYNKLVNDYNALVGQNQTNSQIRLENINLKKEITNLELQIKQIEKDRDELASQRGSILSQLASAQRNPETSYISDSRPQNHLLFQDFRQLKDQELHSVSTKIFSYLSENNPALKANRKQEIANIKAILSNQVLIKAMALFTETNDSLPEDAVAKAVQIVSVSLSSALKAYDKPNIIESLKANIESLVKQGMMLAKGTTETNTLAMSDNEEDFTKVVESIRQSVYSSLEIELDKISEALRAEIDNLVRKGLELVKKIANADPPGTLLLPKKGESFNSDQHKAMLGWEDEGKIDFSIFPAYIVGARVLEKAVVLTIVEETSPTTTEKSINYSEETANDSQNNTIESDNTDTALAEKPSPDKEETPISNNSSDDNQKVLETNRESVVTVLEARLGAIPVNLKEDLNAIKDIEMMKQLLKHAAKANSLEEFQQCFTFNDTSVN